jgi:hypothetical protein
MVGVLVEGVCGGAGGLDEFDEVWSMGFVTE